MNVKIKKIHSNAIIPSRAHNTDAGMDVYWDGRTKNGDGEVNTLINLWPNDDIVLRTGISMALPDGWVAIVKEKSGRATKDKLSIGACVIDSGYRGEVMIHLFNFGRDKVELKIYEAIAQLVILPCWTGQPEEVEDLDETKRGDGGFGSTGLKKLD